MMNDTDKGVFSTKYSAWAGTLHTAAYFPKSMKAWFAIGGNKMPVVFDFNEWLRGEHVHITRVLKRGIGYRSAICECIGGANKGRFLRFKTQEPSPCFEISMLVYFVRG